MSLELCSAGLQGARSSVAVDGMTLSCQIWDKLITKQHIIAMAYVKIIFYIKHNNIKLFASIVYRIHLLRK